MLLLGCAAAAHAQALEFQKIADGVWFVPGNGGKGYCNNVIIEMQHYLIVVDANYPGRAEELIEQIHRISPKPVLFVFDTHAHRDHSYGNLVWTRAGAVTFAYQGVVDEMNRYEPERWQATAAIREDVRALHLTDAPRPELTFSSSRFVLKDATREVDFYFLGWAHTRGDGFVWLPKERILCTGDAAINGRSVVAGREGPRNKLWDANLGNWPRVMEKAEALHPLHVLPGHGEPGGVEILEGQQHFIVDLLGAVQRQVAEGKTAAQMTLSLPARDRDWTPADLSTDFSIAYAEITQRKPAGDIPHVWK
ncbi:MAG TPA: MBL fold metallo-hydrolase [Acidobacteriaceae bacterium]|nr:MBL fold metallo-hydrolase [Acidobacteriaceae bacterium]